MTNDKFLVLVWETKDESRYQADGDSRFQYLCDKKSAIFLHYQLSKEWPHVEIRSLDGRVFEDYQLTGYNP